MAHELATAAFGAMLTALGVLGFAHVLGYIW